MPSEECGAGHGKLPVGGRVAARWQRPDLPGGTGVEGTLPLSLWTQRPAQPVTALLDVIEHGTGSLPITPTSSRPPV
jgi:hypothetical protein